MAILLSEEIKPAVILSLVQNRFKGSHIQPEKKVLLEAAMLSASDEFIEVIKCILTKKLTTPEKLSQSMLAQKIKTFRDQFSSLYSEMAPFQYQMVIAIAWENIIGKLAEELEDSPYRITSDHIQGLRNSIVALSKKPVA